jgi:uncharacterized protein (TIGR02145 family)
MNYITYTDNLTTFVYVKGYNFKWTQYVLLSTTSDNTFYAASAMNPFSSYPRLSAIFPAFDGFVYTNYDIIDDNQLKINLASLSGAGKYDIITLNGAGYVKLSDKGYLVDSLSLVTCTPTPTHTPTCTPSNTCTPSFTPTNTPSVTRTSTCTPSPTPSTSTPVNCIEGWIYTNFQGTTFRNGDAIPQITDQATWNAATGPGWCYYDNDAANDAVYGKLYNRYAVADARGLAPEGFHVPTLTEWQDLIVCLGGSDVGGGYWSVAGAKMKTTGTIQDGDGLWNTPNVATNESLFSVEPAGCRTSAFINLHIRGSFWVHDSDTCINFNNGTSSIYIGSDSANAGYSVRLKQD